MSSSRDAAPAGTFYTLVLLIGALQFGTLIGLLGFRVTGAVEWTLLGGLRDLLVLALLLQLIWLSLTRRQAGSLPASAAWSMLLVLVFALLALGSPSALNIALLNLRRLVLIPLLFAATVLIPWSTLQVSRLMALIVGSSVLVAVIGLAERFAPAALWTEYLRVDDYMLASTFDRFGALGFHGSGRFFSWDLEPWVGGPVRRLVSTYVEPTTLAAGLSAALCLALARHARGYSSGALIVLLVVAGLLTLSKAFLVFLLVLLAWRSLGWPNPRSVWSIALIGTTVGVLLTSFGLRDRAFEHSDGLVEAVRYLMEGNLLGQGIGGAGNFTDQGDDTGGESGLGNAIAQAGVFGLLPLFWLHAIARDLHQELVLRGDPGGGWLSMWLVFWLVSFLFSSSSQGVGGNALGFLMLALYTHHAARMSEPR
jgi:hypothetical protein